MSERTKEFRDIALDALALVRSTQTADDNDFSDELFMILDQYDREEMIELVTMLASLTADLAEEWRSAILTLTPKDMHQYLPTSASLVQDMTDTLLKQELADA